MENEAPKIRIPGLLTEVCSQMNLAADISTVWNCAINTGVRIESIDMIGVNIRQHGTEDYLLESCSGLPTHFIDSCSRFAPGSALHENLKSDSSVFPNSIEESPFICEGSPHE